MNITFSNIIKLLPIFFILIYMVVFFMLMDFSNPYESAWIIAIIDIPISNILYNIIDAFYNQRSIYFDVAFLFVIGIVQYSVIGLLCSKLIHILMIFIKNRIRQ